MRIRSQERSDMRFSLLLPLAFAMASTLSCKNRENSGTDLASNDGGKANEEVKNFNGNLFASCISDNAAAKFSLEVKRSQDSKNVLLTYARTPELASSTEKISIIGELDNAEEKDPAHHLFVFSNLSLIVTIDQMVDGKYPGTVVGKEASGEKIDHHLLCQKI